MGLGFSGWPSGLSMSQNVPPFAAEDGLADPAREEAEDVGCSAGMVTGFAGLGAARGWETAGTGGEPPNWSQNAPSPQRLRSSSASLAFWAASCACRSAKLRFFPGALAPPRRSENASLAGGGRGLAVDARTGVPRIPARLADEPALDVAFEAGLGVDEPE